MKLELDVELEGTSNRLMFVKANLEAAEDAMIKIKEYQFLRKNHEREQQIQNQSLNIQSLQKEISNLQNRIITISTNLNRLELQLNSSAVNTTIN